MTEVGFKHNLSNRRRVTTNETAKSAQYTRTAPSSVPSDHLNATTAASPANTTKYVAIGAWYLSEIDLTDKQEELIDPYTNQQPEAMVGNSIFVFRRVVPGQQ